MPLFSDCDNAKKTWTSKWCCCLSLRGSNDAKQAQTGGCRGILNSRVNARWRIITDSSFSQLQSQICTDLRNFISISKCWKQEKGCIWNRADCFLDGISHQLLVLTQFCTQRSLVGNVSKRNERLHDQCPANIQMKEMQRAAASKWFLP